jgi:hypothetical protein
MDVEKLVKQLTRERDLIDQAIVSIESILREGKRPRGRPTRLDDEERTERAKHSEACGGDEIGL